MAEKWYHLVNPDGSSWTWAGEATVTVEKENVDTLRKAVKLENKDELFVIASNLAVYKNRDAFDTKHPLRSDESIASFGKSMAEALVIVVPPARSVAAATSEVDAKATPSQGKLRWKEEEELTPVLSKRRLFFVNRDRAIEDLCQIHFDVFYGATQEERLGLWPIALADNELGLGKTAFARRYIQRCRDQWPASVSKSDGFYEALTACRTIRVVVTDGAFVDDAVTCGSEELQKKALATTMNKALAKAVVKQLIVPDGATLPEYLTSPGEDLVESIVENLGPVFIVLDEIGAAFQYANPDTEATIKSRSLFFLFCKRVLQLWMNTPKVFFVLLGFAPFLRMVAERPDLEPLAASPFEFIRLGLQLIRPNKIEEIICKTRVDEYGPRTLKDRWGLPDEDVAKAAQVMYQKTCGHPRTMLQMFLKYPSYSDFDQADVSGPNGKEWEKVIRQLRVWKPRLKKWLRKIKTKTPINLSKRYDVPGQVLPGQDEALSRKVPSVTILERCHLGWEGKLTEAIVYGQPRVLLAIASLVEPLHDYIQTLSTVVGHRVTLAYATILEWICLKRFQELFAYPVRPSEKLSRFFGDGTTQFGLWGEVDFPLTVVDLPKITNRKNESTQATMNSATAHPTQWPQLMRLIDEVVRASPTTSLCLKPLAESASADVILLKRDEGAPQPGEKRPHPVSTTRTLTLGLAVKNFRVTQFGTSHLDDECAKFNRMFDNLDAATTENFGVQTNVLIVCSTRYIPTFQREFGEDTNYYAKPVDRTKYPHIHEVLLLDLTTRGLRADFLGLDRKTDCKLVDAVDQLIAKAERERLADDDSKSKS